MLRPEEYGETRHDAGSLQGTAMINEAADELFVNMYVQKAMALATKVQTGMFDDMAADRRVRELVGDALAHFEGRQQAGAAETMGVLVDSLRVLAQRVPVSQPDFSRVLAKVAEQVERGTQFGRRP